MKKTFQLKDLCLYQSRFPFKSYNVALRRQHSYAQKYIISCLVIQEKFENLKEFKQQIINWRPTKCPCLFFSFICWCPLVYCHYKYINGGSTAILDYLYFIVYIWHAVSYRTISCHSYQKAESTGRRQLTNKLIAMGQNDPRLFWNTIKKMNNLGKEKTNLSDNVTTEEWIRHFEHLLNDKKAPTLNIQKGHISFDPNLDGRIELKELREALNQLKRGKAAGPDKIIGEYLKIFARTH